MNLFTFIYDFFNFICLSLNICSAIWFASYYSVDGRSLCLIESQIFLTIKWNFFSLIISLFSWLFEEVWAFFEFTCFYCLFDFFKDLSFAKFRLSFFLFSLFYNFFLFMMLQNLFFIICSVLWVPNYLEILDQQLPY